MISNKTLNNPARTKSLMEQVVVFRNTDEARSQKCVTEQKNELSCPTGHCISQCRKTAMRVHRQASLS